MNGYLLLISVHDFGVAVRSLGIKGPVGRDDVVRNRFFLQNVLAHSQWQW